MIHARALGYEAPGRGGVLLRDIALSVGPGERLGLVGPSGSGKSTLAYHLCGVHALALRGRSTGALRLDGRDALRRGIKGFGGLVLQNPETQLFGRTVEEELRLALPERDRAQRLECLLARTGLAPRRADAIASLSLGWKQRVAIAGMLALEPRVLVLDEPTNYLDEGATDALFADILDPTETTTIVVDHDERRLAGWARRMLRLDSGTLAEDVPADGFRPQGAMARRPHPPPGDVLLELDDVHFSYVPGKPVLAGLSLSLKAGEAVAVLGPNGSGKTTLLRLAKGMLRPGKGRVRLPGGGSPRREVGLVFQNPDESLFAPTVEQEVAFFPRNLGVARPQERAAEALTRLGLAHLAPRAPFTLSWGEKRRVTLAAVLAGGVRVLCLDEPTTGLDRENLERLADLLGEHTRAGGAVLFATHDAAFAGAVASRTLRVGLETP